MMTPTIVATTTAVSALRTTGVSSSLEVRRSFHVVSEADSASESASITKKLTPGTAKPRPTRAGSPAFAARRTDMLTPIQKNGSVISPRHRYSADDALSNWAIRIDQSGDR